MKDMQLVNRVFSRKTLDECIKYGDCKIFKKAADKCLDDYNSNENGLQQLYELLRKCYRSEYYYKNILLNKLLLGRHSLRTTAALSELPVARSKADFVLINGRPVVYEIKTELDNFNRLNTQLGDYYKAFGVVEVVTSESNCESVCSLLADSSAGILVLNSKDRLSRIRKPMENYASLDSAVIFDILRKNEYEAIIQEICGTLPNVSEFEKYRACKALFATFSMKEIYPKFVLALKKRQKVDENLFKDIPYELKALAYFNNMSKSDYGKLRVFLDT